MKCKVCKSKMGKRNGEVDLRYESKLVLVKNVDYLECENCGERIFSRETTSQIMKRLKTKPARKYVRVPVYA